MTQEYPKVVKRANIAKCYSNNQETICNLIDT